MVTVRVGDTNVSILFKTDYGVGRLAKNGIENVTQVSCALVGTHGRVLAAGNAFCSPKDDIDMPKGMELALGRALQRLTPDKQLRAKFWDVFNRAVAGQMLEARREEEQFEQQLQSVFEGAGVIDVEPLPIVPPRTFEMQKELDELRERVQRAEALHTEFGDQGASADCWYCNGLREKLAALEGA